MVMVIDHADVQEDSEYPEWLWTMSVKRPLPPLEEQVRTWCTSPHTLHLTPYTCHLTPVTSHLSPYTCHLTPVTLHLPPVSHYPPPPGPQHEGVLAAGAEGHEEEEEQARQAQEILVPNIPAPSYPRCFRVHSVSQDVGEEGEGEGGHQGAAPGEQPEGGVAGQGAEVYQVGWKTDL